MAKKRIYQNVVSVRLTDTETSKLETVIQKFKTNKSEFLRDWINRFLETI
jgi:metal-responsive CopG/Arc/MetJ family transcriptional regulator